MHAYELSLFAVALLLVRSTLVRMSKIAIMIEHFDSHKVSLYHDSRTRSDTNMIF